MFVFSHLLANQLAKCLHLVYLIANQLASTPGLLAPRSQCNCMHKCILPLSPSKPLYYIGCCAYLPCFSLKQKREILLQPSELIRQYLESLSLSGSAGAVKFYTSYLQPLRSLKCTALRYTLHRALRSTALHDALHSVLQVLLHCNLANTEHCKALQYVVSYRL